MIKDSAQREAFEKWAITDLYKLEVDNDGHYRHIETNWVWRAWQAAQHQFQPLKDLSDYLDGRLPIAEEGQRSKQDEWEAAYAFMFKRMNDLLQEMRGYRETIPSQKQTHDAILKNWEQDRELIRELVEALNQTSEAYCGVGDFEGTGENMAVVIVQVRAVIQKANQRLKENV